jgi:imidazole glycerol phosphate synthase subunit HisF
MRRTPVFVLACLLALACKSHDRRSDAEDVVQEEPVDAPEDPVADPATDDEEERTGCTGDAECDDSDPCTDDACDVASGTCSHDPVDRDGDGHAAAEVDGTTCAGDDCDDEHEEVHPGAEPGCGTDPTDPLSDLDCDGHLDGDVDGDGHVSEPCSGDDCDDTRADVHPDASEVCNDGVDQDCDTLVDGAIVVLGDVLVTNEGGNPSIEWTGSEYGVAYEKRRSGFSDVNLARVQPDGTVTATDVRITDQTSNSLQPKLAWTGSEYGVCFIDDRGSTVREVFFASFATDGTTSVAEVQVSEDPGVPSSDPVAWSGSEFAVVWTDNRDGNHEIYFARISASGTKIGADLRITNEAHSSRVPWIAWGGSEFGVVWRDERDGNPEIYFARISASGTKEGTDVRVTNEPAGCNAPSIAWSGSEYGLAWADGRAGAEYDVYFARLSPSGSMVGSVERLTTGNVGGFFPYTLWAGGRFGVTWYDRRDDPDLTDTDYVYEVFFCAVSATGTKIGGDLRITSNGVQSRMPSLAWSGSEHLIAWMDDRTGSYQLFVNRISYCD